MNLNPTKKFVGEWEIPMSPRVAANSKNKKRGKVERMLPSERHWTQMTLRNLAVSRLVCMFWSHATWPALADPRH